METSRDWLRLIKLAINIGKERYLENLIVARSWKKAFQPKKSIFKEKALSSFKTLSGF